MKLILVLCLVALALAQVPRPCVSPKQWESREIRSNYQAKFQEFRKISYDETNKRIREIEEVIIGTDKNYYDILYLYNDNKNYTLDLKTRKCTVTGVSGPFRYRGIYPNAQLDGIFNIGAVGVQGEYAAVQAWSANDTSGDFYTGVVTYPSCYPVRNFYYSQKYGISHSDYFDVNVGIIDLNVFIPRPECMMAEKHL